MVEYNQSCLSLRKGFVDKIDSARPAMQLDGLPSKILRSIVWVGSSILLLRIRGVSYVRRIGFPVSV